MVNTETLGSGRSRLHFAISQSVGPLLHDLGQKLEADSALETTQRLASIPRLEECRNPLELMKLVDETIASTLASDVATAAGIHLAKNDLETTETFLGGLLAARARRHMNTLEHVPHIASEAAQLLITLETASLTRGPNTKVFSNNLNLIKNCWDEKEARVHETEKISFSDFQTFRNNKVDCAFSYSLQSIIACCDTIECIVSESIFPLSCLAERKKNPSITFSTLLAFESRENQNKKLMSLVENMHSKTILQDARKHVTKGRWLQALEKIFDSIASVQEICSVIQDTEPSPSIDPRQNRFLEGENFLYVRALARQILVTGAAPRDVEKITHALFEYAAQNNAACAELRDEEILALNPNIRREALAKARLEVRLSDKSFPLSAGHKEWIVQTTKPFTPERTVVSDSP